MAKSTSQILNWFNGPQVRNSAKVRIPIVGQSVTNRDAALLVLLTDRDGYADKRRIQPLWPVTTELAESSTTATSIEQTGTAADVAISHLIAGAGWLWLP